MDVKLKLFRENINNIFILMTILIILFLIPYISAANPQGPDVLNSISNSTKGDVAGKIFNVSGGNISKLNLSAVLKNTRWKAFVGNVSGSFTLDDAASQTIYDWTLSSITGIIYTTRNSSTPSWANLNCTDNATIRRQQLEDENTNLGHSNADDNITATFDNFTHASFWVGSVSIAANTCPTARTYVNDVPQTEVGMFEEMAIYETVSNYTLYATIIEENAQGYDGDTYDFQMILPENGSAAWTSSTAYYLYVEIGN